MADIVEFDSYVNNHPVDSRDYERDADVVKLGPYIQRNEARRAIQDAREDAWRRMDDAKRNHPAFQNKHAKRGYAILRSINRGTSHDRPDGDDIA